MNEELIEILNSMDIPKERRNDIFWLARNLPIRNFNNPKLNRALELLKPLVLSETRKMVDFPED